MFWNLWLTMELRFFLQKSKSNFQRAIIRGSCGFLWLKRRWMWFENSLKVENAGIFFRELRSGGASLDKKNWNQRFVFYASCTENFGSISQQLLEYKQRILNLDRSRGSSPDGHLSAFSLRQHIPGECESQSNWPRRKALFIFLSNDFQNKYLYFSVISPLNPNIKISI